MRNVTIIYKPNSFIYHICQTSHSINFKRIRWDYESLYDTDTSCKHLFNNSDCFDFYYGPSTSLLVVKEPDLFIGKYTCHVNLNSTHEIKSTAWIDVKLPSYGIDEDNPLMEMYHENELGILASYYNVPFIFDDNDLTSFGKRVQLGGIFHTQCKSVESSYAISFIWMHLRNTLEGLKTIRFVQHDGNRILIEESEYSSKPLFRTTCLLITERNISNSSVSSDDCLFLSILFVTYDLRGVSKYIIDRD